MHGELNGKAAFVTGAGSGIGLAIALAFAREGASVVLADKNETAAREVAADIRARGGQATAVHCDVTSEPDILQAMDVAVRAFQAIDILVNNAGLQYVSPIEAFPTETFERMIRVMLTAPFMTIKHAFPMMKKQRYGRIINIASINGLVGFSGKAAYNSAKHGVIGLTKVVALEGAAYGITVNALCPGYVDTPLVRNQLADLAATRNIPVERVLEDVIYPLVPQKRLLAPDEVADYAVFLASDRAKSVTGQAVVIDGGYTAQ
jgi:3-hydroxybutyrate dehydrogenase